MSRGSGRMCEGRRWVWIAGFLAGSIAIAGCSKRSSSATAGGRTAARESVPDSGAADLLPSDQAELQRLKGFMTGALRPQQQYPTVKAMAENLRLAPEVRDQARAYLKELQARLRKEGEAALAPVVKAASAFLEEGKPAEALSAYDQFVAGYPAVELPLIEDLVDARREEVKKKIAERFASDKAKIEGALAEGRFDEAIAIARDIGSYGDEERRAWAAEEDARITELKRKRDEEMERRLAESQRRAYEEEIAKEEERKKAAEKKAAAGAASEGAAAGESAGEAPASAQGEEDVEPSAAGEAAPPARDEAAKAGEPFAMAVSLVSFDKKTGMFEIRPLQAPSGPKRNYKLQIPDGAQCHVDAIVPPAQYKILERGCEVWLYGTTIERSRPTPTGNTYDRMIQNPEAVAFGVAIRPDRTYANPRIGAEAKWHQGRLAEWERGPLPIVIEGRTYELRGRPQNECFFRRSTLELAEFRKNAPSFAHRVAVVLGEAGEEKTDPGAKGSATKTPTFVVRAMACLLIEPRLARLPVYRALYEKYDPRAAAEVAPDRKDDKGAAEKKAGRTR